MPDDLREACARVARRARHVAVNDEAVPAYAASLPAALAHPTTQLASDARSERAAYWLTLDAINFGSGWFPTLRKRPGRSGYDTIAAGVTARFERDGPWSAQQLQVIEAAELAELTGQDPGHELIALFADSLRDLGGRLLDGYDGDFTGPIDDAAGSAPTLVQTLASWPCFEDCSSYGPIVLPFRKRAQLAVADLARAGVAPGLDLSALTMFADNLVPHVLRLDGILSFEPSLVARIERGELIEHGSEAEVEIRACAVHAVELIVASSPGATAAEIDELLWNRGREPRYKASPRHRSRCRAY